jgi:subtilisin family serine protease
MKLKWTYGTGVEQRSVGIAVLALALVLSVASWPERLVSWSAAGDGAATANGRGDDDLRLAESRDAAEGTPLTIARARELLNWPAAAGTCGLGLRIGMIDSGVDTRNADLAGARIVTRDFVTGAPPAAGARHGTDIARILVGADFGMLQGAQVFAANIFRESEGGERAKATDLLRAMDWLMQQNVSVINLSLVTFKKSPVLDLAVVRALSRGIVVVAAAGNGGGHASPAYPAAIDGVVAVTAVDGAMELYRLANQGSYVDLAAPGVQLLFDATPRSGTSFAVPFVTAELAVQISRLPARDRRRGAAATDALLANARDLGKRGWDAKFGWGLAMAGGACSGS